MLFVFLLYCTNAPSPSGSISSSKSLTRAFWRSIISINFEFLAIKAFLFTVLFVFRLGFLFAFLFAFLAFLHFLPIFFVCVFLQALCLCDCFDLKILQASTDWHLQAMTLRRAMEGYKGLRYILPPSMSCGHFLIRTITIASSVADVFSAQSPWTISFVWGKRIDASTCEKESDTNYKKPSR